MTSAEDYIPIIHNRELHAIKIIDPKDIPKLPKYTCQRCGHTWTPRTEKPEHCPKCNSPYWNKPRKKRN